MGDSPQNEVGEAIGLENSNFEKTYGSSLKETASSGHQQPDCRKRIFYGPPHIASENTNLQPTNRDTTQYNYSIGATHLLNRCHPPIYRYTRKGGFIGSIERGVDSLAWGDWVVL